METLFELMDSLNNSRYFAGIIMLLLNLGSKYISMELSQTHELFLGSKIVRRLLIFTIVFTATRDVFISIVLTAAFVILVSGLFHDDSSYCLIPKKFRKHSDGTKKVTDEEFKYAKHIIEMAEKQKKGIDILNKDLNDFKTIRKDKYRKNINAIHNMNLNMSMIR